MATITLIPGGGLIGDGGNGVTVLVPGVGIVQEEVSGAGTDNLTATNIVTGSPVLGTPTIGQVHALLADSIVTEAPVFGTPTIAQIHALVAENIVTGAPVLDTPILGQAHVLAAVGIITGAPQLGTPTLDAATLVADSILTGSPVLGAPTLESIAKPTNIVIRPVITRIFDFKEIVERLDPGRHGPEVVYEFSNGRKFIKHGDGYTEVSIVNDVITYPVTVEIFNIGEIVERLDPDPGIEVSYEFSSGRKFTEI